MSPSPEQLVQALRSQLGARALQGLWIFGSRATGMARPDSDLDLGVLCEPELGLERVAVAEPLSRALRVEIDLIDLRSADPILAWEVLTTGSLIHEADELAVERFLREARFRAEDADQRNRMILLTRGPSR